MAEIDSAIYVDFDNIFTSLLKCYSNVVAENYVTYISTWMKFISTAGLKPSDKRVFRKRAVYINPCSFSRQRNIFVRAGFRAIDCPPLTQHEKTATDMYMAVDIVNDLRYHSYNDYVILSGDADFTPVLLHINESSKNSVLLGIGKISTVYASIASTQVLEKDFVSQFSNLPSYFQQLGGSDTAEENGDVGNNNLQEGSNSEKGWHQPYVRVIKRGGDGDKINDTRSSDWNNQSAVAKQQPKQPTVAEQQQEPRKERTTLKSFSELADALKHGNGSDTPQSATDTSETKTETQSELTERAISLQEIGLPDVASNVINAIFEQSSSYVKELKSPSFYVRSVCKKVRNQFADVSKEDIKKFLKYIPYNSLQTEESAKEIFVNRFCNENATVLKNKNWTGENIKQVLMS